MKGYLGSFLPVLSGTILNEAPAGEHPTPKAGCEPAFLGAPCGNLGGDLPKVVGWVGGCDPAILGVEVLGGDLPEKAPRLHFTTFCSLSASAIGTSL